MSEVVVPVLVITLLVLMNGLFVAAEFAVVAARRPRVEQLARAGKGGAKAVRHIISSPANQDHYIAIAQLGITLATIGLGMYGEPSIARWIYGPVERAFGVSETFAHTLGTVLAVAVMTYFHVVVGEMIPKALALESPERTALGVVQPLRLTGFVFYPLVFLLNSLARGLLKLLRVPIQSEERRYTAQELSSIVHESFEGGALQNEEQALIANIFDFGERQVHQIMTPRPRVKGVSVTASEAEVRALLEKSSHSRLPVFEGDLDHIVGVLHVKDFIKQQTEAPDRFDLRALMRRAPRVPEGMAAERLLSAFKRLKVHLAVVMDEFGGTAGIVTLEDLLEEVVGEVQEFGSQHPEVEVLGDGVLRVRGGVLLSELSEHYALELTSDTAETLAGLVIDEVGRPPQVGDEVDVAGVRLRVEEVVGLAVETVRLELSETRWQGVRERLERSSARAGKT